MCDSSTLSNLTCGTKLVKFSLTGKYVNPYKVSELSQDAAQHALDPY